MEGKNKREGLVSEELLARAKANNLSISTKHSVELCRYLRYKTTLKAKRILEEVISLKRAIPFKRYKRDIGHKKGIGAGRFPQKAAKEILKLIKRVEANAQFKGLNITKLKIIKLLANKASCPLTGGRFRTSTKRTHLEIEVQEILKEGKAKVEKKEKKKEEIKKEIGKGNGNNKK